MKPEQIEVGKSYRISGRGIVPVEAIQDGKVIVEVKGRRVEADIKVFARLALEEVT